MSPPEPSGANERRALLAVAHGMIGPKRRPAGVTHGNARPGRHGFKHNLHMSALAWGKVHSLPFKLQSLGRLPDRNPSVGEHPGSVRRLDLFHESTAQPRFEPQYSALFSCDAKLRSGPPPKIGLTRE